MPLKKRNACSDFSRARSARRRHSRRACRPPASPALHRRSGACGRGARRVSDRLRSGANPRPHLRCRPAAAPVRGGAQPALARTQTRSRAGARAVDGRCGAGRGVRRRRAGLLARLGARVRPGVRRADRGDRSDLGHRTVARIASDGAAAPADRGRESLQRRLGGGPVHAGPGMGRSRCGERRRPVQRGERIRHHRRRRHRGRVRRRLGGGLRRRRLEAITWSKQR